ncbi:hypothetical protein [Lysinibacillus sp. SGAir0095]|uniref:hypothetical protein n=1 Tax=Lysinibacillus sp. SGAir0095 TaxID=2070463 RepID=UPI0010CCFC59|nr:hypothetical protein [Lysinibacillus sp. SGAir0095]QCR32670.1 hypothetical protein C1N55_11025 [Lysinibacillus sp. SGAir0095]
MKKLWYVPFLLLVLLSIVGCNADTASETETSENINETTEIIEQDLEEVQEDSLRESEKPQTDTELQNEPDGATGENSEQHPPVNDDVGGQGIEDEGQNHDANTVQD